MIFFCWRLYQPSQTPPQHKVCYHYNYDIFDDSTNPPTPNPTPTHHHGSAAAEAPVEFQGGWKNLNLNLEETSRDLAVRRFAD